MAESDEIGETFALQVEVNNVLKTVTVTKPVRDRINSSDPVVREAAYADIHRLYSQRKSVCKLLSSYLDSETTLTENSPAVENSEARSASENLENVLTSTSLTSMSRVVPLPASFTKEQTRCLISLYKERMDKFESPAQKKKTLWLEVTNELNLECGTTFTQKQVEGRWKTIVAVYRKHKDERNKSGNSAKVYEYEKELDEILIRNHDTAPVYTVSSTEHEKSKESLKSQERSSSSSDPEGEPVIKKRKSRVTTSGKVIEFMKSLSEEEKKREEERMNRVEKMHQEKMTLFREFIEVIKKDKSD